jgi:hypothetical protein
MPIFSGATIASGSTSGLSVAASLAMGEAGQTRVPTHHCLAFLVRCDIVDIVEAIGCSRFNHVDNALRAAPAIRQDNL